MAEAIVSSNQTSSKRCCIKCGKEKLLTDFALNQHQGRGYEPDRRRTSCKRCCAEYARNYKRNPPTKRTKLPEEYRKSEEYLAKNRQWARKTKLKTFYHLTLEQYQAMSDAQGGVCAICGKSETWVNSSGKVCPLSVDHDHATGQVRALLCARCNRKCMQIETSPAHVAYLKKHRSAIIVDLLP